LHVDEAVPAVESDAVDETGNEEEGDEHDAHIGRVESMIEESLGDLCRPRQLLQLAHLVSLGTFFARGC
jgi:hypothetical protein